MLSTYIRVDRNECRIASHFKYFPVRRSCHHRGGTGQVNGKWVANFNPLQNGNRANWLQQNLV